MAQESTIISAYGKICKAISLLESIGLNVEPISEQEENIGNCLFGALDELSRMFADEHPEIPRDMAFSLLESKISFRT